MGIFKKNKQLYQTTQLANEGITLPPQKVNPIGFKNKNRDKYKTLWNDYYLQQGCSKYIWKNLPNGYKSWEIERMLYFRGGIAGFNYSGSFYILPYVIQGGLNLRGLPTKIKPIPFTCNDITDKDTFIDKDFELEIDSSGNENKDINALLLFDRVPFFQSNKPIGRFILNQPIIEDICDALARVAISIIVSTKKLYVVIKDANQADIVRKELEESLGSDSPFEVITSPLEVQDIGDGINLEADSLFTAISNYDSLLARFGGVRGKHFGTDKKERLVSGELQGDETQSDLVEDISLEFRQEWADKVNRLFGFSITVEARQDKYEQDVDGENGSEITDEEELKKHD